MWTCIEPDCSKAYSLKCNLLQHIRKKHHSVYVDIKEKRREIADPYRRDADERRKSELEEKKKELKQLRAVTEFSLATRRSAQVHAGHPSSPPISRAPPGLVIPVPVPAAEFRTRMLQNYGINFVNSDHATPPSNAPQPMCQATEHGFCNVLPAFYQAQQLADGAHVYVTPPSNVPNGLSSPVEASSWASTAHTRKHR